MQPASALLFGLQRSLRYSKVRLAFDAMPFFYHDEAFPCFYANGNDLNACNLHNVGFHADQKGFLNLRIALVA